MSGLPTSTEPGPGTSPGAPRRPSEALINLLVALLCLIWGSTWLVIKTGLKDLPPFTSAGVRFAIAAAVMIGLAPLLAKREGGGKPRAWLWIVLGSLNFGASYGLVYYSEQTLPSGLVSVLWSVFPLLMAASGHLFLPGERLGPRHWAGFVLAFAGILVLFRTDVTAVGPEAVGVALLLLLSPTVSVVGQTAVKRYGEGTSSVLLNRNGMCLGAALLLGAGWLFERDASFAWTRPALISIVYLALVGTVLTFSLYFWLLRYAASYRLSLIAYVTPAVALTLGWLFGGEPMTRATLAGSALVLAGVVLAARKSRRR